MSTADHDDVACETCQDTGKALIGDREDNCPDCEHGDPNEGEPEQVMER